MRVQSPPPVQPQFLLELPDSRSIPEWIRFASIAAPDYPHWHKLRFREPPEGLSLEAWWSLLVIGRSAHQFPLVDQGGEPFIVGLPDPVLRLLSEIDRRAAGTISSESPPADLPERETYLHRSLIEEAITSSQLEGAAVTRKVAKEMLRSGRAPRDRDEQMIANNLRALEFAKDQKEEELTPAVVLELHRIVTAQTLDDSSAAGRFRRVDEDIVVQLDGEVVHNPPDASELPKRLERLCAFANGQDLDFYVHPVVRATLLHFWLAYDHPFVDGNGRAARSLFYWSMLREGYWLTEFLSVSRLLKKAPAQYAASFLKVETDRNDATYFVLDQLRILARAIEEFYEHVRSEAARSKEVRRSLVEAGDLNHRQIALLELLQRAPGTEFTIAAHRRRHGVAYATARADLLGLEEGDFLRSRKVGRKFVFSAQPPE